MASDAEMLRWIAEGVYFGLTSDSALVGTPYFMAPEAIRAAGFTAEMLERMDHDYRAKHTSPADTTVTDLALPDLSERTTGRGQLTTEEIP